MNVIVFANLKSTPAVSVAFPHLPLPCLLLRHFSGVVTSTRSSIPVNVFLTRRDMEKSSSTRKTQCKLATLHTITIYPTSLAERKMKNW